MDFPAPIFAPTYLSSLSGNAAASSMAGAISSAAGLTWVANLAVYMPIYLFTPYTVRRVFCAAAGTATNFDVGIYAASGERIASTGSFAKGATGVNYQSLDTLLTPGRYYLGFSANTGAANIVTGGNAGATTLELAGVLEEAAAFPLPATMTPATITHALYPIVGFTSTT